MNQKISATNVSPSATLHDSTQICALRLGVIPFKKHNYVQFELQRRQFYFSIEIVPDGCFVQE